MAIVIKLLWLYLLIIMIVIRLDLGLGPLLMGKVVGFALGAEERISKPNIFFINF